MPTVVQLQNAAAAVVAVGVMASVLYVIAVTVDYVITAGHRRLSARKAVR